MEQQQRGPASAASARLQVLAQQLATQPTAAAGAVASSAPSASEDEVRPAPGGGKGTLTIVDNRTGKKYTVRGASFVRHGASRGRRIERGRTQGVSRAAAGRRLVARAHN